MPNVITARVVRVLAPDASPLRPGALVITHSVTIANWRRTGLEETPRWRLRVTLVNDTHETGCPWSFRPAYTIEEHVKPDMREPGDWVPRYAYRTHDKALAQLEVLADKEPHNA
jgi:hypothetical protein